MVTPGAIAPVSKMFTPSASRTVVLPLEPSAFVKRCSRLCVVENPKRVATLLVLLPVPIGALRSELIRRGHPPHGAAARKRAIELRGFDPERAVVVADHRVVPKTRRELTLEPDTGREVRTKNSSAITRSLPSQKGCEPWSDRDPGNPLRPP